MRHRSYNPGDRRQSWFGTLALVLGLLGLFCLGVQGMVMLQAAMGSPGSMRMTIEWVTRGELLTSLLGICFALVSFPFSARRQRNATIGLLLSVVILGAWIWLGNWRWAGG